MLGKFINVGIMSNPFNWVTLTLMVVIGGLAIHLIFNVAPNTSGD